MLSLLNKAKVRADDIVIGTIIVSVVSLFFASIFILIVSSIVYPMIALFINGIIRLKRAFRDNYLESVKKLLNGLYGVFSIIVSILILGMIVIQPPITLSVLVILLGFPLQIVGFAGMAKGVMIDIYSLKYRIINILLGLITVVLSFYSIMNSDVNPPVQLIILSTLLLLTIISRFGMYLSEFGLSIIDPENFKVVFMIINGYYISLEEDTRYKMTKYSPEN